MEAFLSVFHLSVIQGKGQKKVKNKIDFKVTLVFFYLFFSSLLFSFLIVNSTRPQCAHTGTYCDGRGGLLGPTVKWMANEANLIFDLGV